MSTGALITTLAKDIEGLSHDVAQDDASRKYLLDVLQSAVTKVELPVETIWRMIMSVSNNQCA